jgi:hypothetical protein
MEITSHFSASIAHRQVERGNSEQSEFLWTQHNLELYTLQVAYPDMMSPL